MKRKRLFLGMAALLAAGGLWLARSGWRSDPFSLPKTSAGAGPEMGESGLHRVPKNTGGPGQDGVSTPDHTLRPPDQARRFMDFTPEQRVEFARKGHGPGG